MTRTKRRIATVVVATGALLLLAACATSTSRPGIPPLQLARDIDLSRYAGTWYVIASIPTFLEKDAYDARETYRLESDGTMATTFVWRPGSFDAEPRTLRSRGFPQPGHKAIWGQKFIWPIKADYRISFVADDYSQTVVARQKRDNVWIMARTPTIPEADLQRLIDFAVAQGYDAAKIERVPQRPR